MGTGSRILAVLEDGRCREESVRYALELAKRTRGRVEVLILFPSAKLPGELLPGEGSQEPGEVLGRSLRQVAADEGIPLATYIKHGDKASELVKHMAGRRRIDMLVWGGDEAALSGAPRAAKHWFARVRSEIACPVVTATKKPTTQ
ncbi:MAG: universal stress protein [Myxococcota bacterium]